MWGLLQAGGDTAEMSHDEAITLFNLERLEDRKELLHEYGRGGLSGFSILEQADTPLRDQVQEQLQDGFADPCESRAVGCVLGLVVGDALGAPLEFCPVQYGSTTLRRMGQPEVWACQGHNKFCLKPGQWTDDASMSLCLADSLLSCKQFSPKDLRLRFLNWWQFGYNNAFHHDAERKGSVGLGGNISQSFSEFYDHQTEYTTAGDRNTSGNGSAMRLAPAPVYYWRDPTEAMRISYHQSKTTHQGDEAASCCSLMAHIITSFIAGAKSDGPALTADELKRTVLLNLHKTWQGEGSDLYSVQCLAASEAEERHPNNQGLPLKDRNWNWRDEDYRYCSSRAKQMPGYIGSYVMDGLSMALHCLWTTESFDEALLKAVNMRGDADTVGAITGQLAGALYGAESIPKDWFAYVQKWDKQDTIAARACKLYRARESARQIAL